MESFNSRFDKKLNENFKVLSDLNEFEPWGRAVDILNRIKEADKFEDLERLLDFEFPEGLYALELNDYLVSDEDQILHDLGLSEYPKTIKVKVWGIEYEDDVDATSKPTEMEVEVEVEDEYDDIREKVHDAIYDELPTGIGYYDISDFEFEEIKDKVEESVNESSEIDKIDADADDKKEKLKAFMRNKIDDIDADRDDKKEKMDEDFLDDFVTFKVVYPNGGIKEVQGKGALNNLLNQIRNSYGSYWVFKEDPKDKSVVYLVTSTSGMSQPQVAYQNKLSSQGQQGSTLPKGFSYNSILASYKKKKNGKKINESDKPAATSIEDAQKWVDYDMKKYGEISKRTNRLVRKAGFQIVKDTYGDYEVIAGKYGESLNEDVNIYDLADFIEKAIGSLKDGYEGCYFYELENGLHYVMALMDSSEFDDSDKIMRDKDGWAIVGKIAMNTSDLQSDFDWDWTMPYYEDGDVYDTETTFDENELPGEIANRVIADLNHLKNLEIDENGKILSK